MGLHSMSRHVVYCPPFRHQVVADQSGMDRGFEVSGGANGATPTEDLPSENLGMLLLSETVVVISQMKS